MVDILAIVAPIFILIAAGYVAVGLSLVHKTQLKGMSAFLIYFAMPALILRSLVQRPLSEVFNTGYLLAYGLSSIAVFLIGLGLLHYAQKKDLQTSALSALGMTGSNSGFIGYPIAALAIGAPAGLALALCMLIENFVIIPAALAIAEAGLQAGLPTKVILRSSLIRLIRSPIILAILAGTTISALGIVLPSPIFKTVDMLALASAPVALFVIGGTLVGLKVKGLRTEVAQIVLGKLIIHPVAVLIAFMVFAHVDADLTSAAIIMASVPMLSIYPILGQRYGMDEVCAAALMASTIMSVLTTSVAIWLVKTSTFQVTAG
jgi:malonate transporter and related proteins